MKASELQEHDFFNIGGRFHKFVGKDEDDWGLVFKGVRLVDGAEVKLRANDFVTPATAVEVEDWQREVIRRAANHQEWREQIVRFICDTFGEQR